MAKQIKIILTDEQAKRFNKLAVNHFRRPSEHARYLVISALRELETATPTQQPEQPVVAGQ